MKIPLALTLMLSSVAVAEPPPVIVQWQQGHPAAADSLAGWIQANRDSAKPIFHWARAHPLRAQAFVKWLVDHPKQGLDEFVAGHANWPAVELVLKPNRPALEALVQWQADHKAAANDLAAVPRGLAIVGFHLYPELWDSSR